MLFSRWIPLLGLCLLLNSQAFGQTRSQVYGDDLTRQAQTLYVSGTTGMTTFESEAAGSKETKGSNSYEIGGWFGEARIVGLNVSSHSDLISFSLNQSSSKQNFTDVRMAGRLWWFTPSVGISVSEVDVIQAGTKTVGLFGTGINTGLGANVSIYKGLVVSADAMRVHNNHVYDKLSQSAALGDRSEADAHIAFDITDRIVDLIVGYRTQNYEIQTENETYNEKNAGAYAGVRFGVYF